MVALVSIQPDRIVISISVKRLNAGILRDNVACTKFRKTEILQGGWTTEGLFSFRERIQSSSFTLVLSLNTHHRSRHKPHDQISQFSHLFLVLGDWETPSCLRDPALNGFYYILLTDWPSVRRHRDYHTHNHESYFIYQKSCPPLSIHMLGESAHLLDDCWRIFAVHSTHICRSISASDGARAANSCRHRGHCISLHLPDLHTPCRAFPMEFTSDRRHKRIIVTHIRIKM